MKILLLINSLSTGGAEFSTLSFYGWLKKLLKDKLELNIVCLKTANPSYDVKTFGLDEVIILEGSNSFKKFNHFSRIVKNLKPDILHSVLFQANIFGRFLRLRTGSRLIHLESLVNETYSDFRLKDPKVNKFKLEVYRLFDYITQVRGTDFYQANGISVARHYQKKLGIPPDKIKIVPRGRRANPFLKSFNTIEEYREEFQAKGKTLFIIVARHEYQKGYDIILEALNEIKDLEKDFIFLFAGREGEQTSLIKEKIIEYDLKDNCKLLGHRTDIPQILAASDFFVFPTRFEGLPGALIEAEAAGLPIICSNISNNLEVVREDENALVFPVDDKHKLAYHLREVIQNPGKYKAMGDVSLKIFEENFNFEKVHNEMYKLLIELTKRSIS